MALLRPLTLDDLDAVAALLAGFDFPYKPPHPLDRAAVRSRAGWDVIRTSPSLPRAATALNAVGVSPEVAEALAGIAAYTSVAPPVRRDPLPVYNYVWGQSAEGDTPADDAPPFIVNAIEDWVASQTLEGAAAITVAELAEPRLTLLVLHGENSAGELDYLHAVIVPDRQLAADTPPRRLRQLFESLYGGRLDRALPTLCAELGGLPSSAVAPRVLRHFATDADIEALRWLRMGARRIASRPAQPASPSLGGPSRWRLPAAIAAGALALLVGVVVGAWLSNPDGLPAVSAKGELPGQVAALEARVEELTRAVESADDERRFARARLEELTRARTSAPLPAPPLEPAVVAAASTPEAKRVAASAPRPVVPGAEVVTPAPAAPAPVAPTLLQPDAAVAQAPKPLAPADPSPPVAASPRAAGAASQLSLPGVAAAPPQSTWMKVVVDTARVRSEPSGESATRGLVARDTRLVALSRKDDWVEIQPPEGFAGPTWVHDSLVERR